jgi:osmoprotectant transport system substrate-binding protein
MQIRRTLTTALAVAALGLATACAGDDLPTDEAQAGSDGGARPTGEVTLATQNFPEANLLAAMYEAVLSDADYDVTVNAVDTRDVYMPQIPGDVDVVPEYLGGVAEYLNQAQNGPEAEPLTTGDPEETLENVQPLLEEESLELLELSEATSQNAYFVTREFAEQNDVQALSDLEGRSVVLAAAPDCEGRADCEAGLEEVYGIEVTKVLPLGFASPQTYQAVLSGEAQVGQTGTLDGTLEEQGLVLLEDDRDIQPAQNLVPLVAKGFLDHNPTVSQPLNDLMAALDNDTLAQLLVRVTVDRETPEAVAEDFLAEEGLIG